MRKVAWLALVLVVVVLLVFLLIALNLPSRARSGVTVQNGDANGDGVIDISDPLYLLRYLFQEGAAPVACADSPALLARVAALEEAIAELRNPCEERPDRFTDNGDGTLTDECTGLMWLRESLDTTGDSVPDQMTWDEAIAKCAGLDFAGHADWRLPTIAELDGLVVRRRAKWLPAIVEGIPITPPSTPGLTLWSSSPVSEGLIPNLGGHPHTWWGDIYSGQFSIRQTAGESVGRDYARAVRGPVAP